MNQEDTSPFRTSVRRVSTSSGKGSTDRRPLQFWKTFNTWWRQNLEQTGRRHGSDDITRWYEMQADFVWGPDKPSLHETRTHAKCLRAVSSVREYFREYRKKKHDHTSSEDDEEDIVCRQGSMPGMAADAADLELGLFSYSRRPSRDSGTPAASPAARMTGTYMSEADLQDSGHWQAAMYSGSSSGQSSRGGKTGRGRGRGRARQHSCSMEPVPYDVHPGALGPDIMDAAVQPSSGTAAAPAHGGWQLQQPPMQVNVLLPSGFQAPGLQPGTMHSEAMKCEAVGQPPYCSPRGIASTCTHDQGFSAAPVVPGGLSSSAAATATGIAAAKQQPAGLELAYSIPWMQEQQLQQRLAQQQQQQYQQEALAHLTTTQGTAGQLASHATVVDGSCQMPSLAGAPVASGVQHMNSAAVAAGIKMEAGLMPQNFLSQFAGQQQQQPPMGTYTVGQQQQVLHAQQQVHVASQPSMPSTLTAGPQQNHVQQKMHPPHPLELQRQPSVQHDLHKLHQQFIQEAKPTPRGFPPPLLFSDNTKLGCEDIIPPPPLFSSGVGSGLPPMGLNAISDDLMQQQQWGMAAAAAAATVGSSIEHNSAGILSELEAIKGPAMAGLVDGHCASQQQRISVSALLDAGPFGPAARRLSQGLDLHSGLSLPHQRLSLCAMGSDVLGDFLGDFGCLGDLDAFLGSSNTATAGTASCNEPLMLPRISEGGCGAMAPPSATGRPSLRWNILGDHWHNAAVAAPACNKQVAAAATACPSQAGTSSARQQAAPHSAVPGSAPFGLQLDWNSPSHRNAGLMSPPGVDYTVHAAAVTGRKRARCSTSKMPAGLVLDVNCVKRPRVSGLLMDMDTPKVRAMAVGAGITVLTPKSPAVTPNRIAALAAALAKAAAAVRRSDDAAAGKDKEAAKNREVTKPLPSHKFVLNLGDSPVALGAADHQQQLPGPAFQSLFGGQPCDNSGAAAADKEAIGESSPAAAAPPPVKKAVVLNLCDDPLPAGFGKATAQTTSVPVSGQITQLAEPTASSVGSMGGSVKGTKAFLPALHEIESMI